MSQDPDRFDPVKEGGLSGRTLPELLGDGAHEGERDNRAWLSGLLAVIGFLVVVSLLLQL